MLDKLAPLLRRKCLSALCKICGCHGLLPRSVQIPLSYDRMVAPQDEGGYAEVWKSEYQGREVAVKVLKVSQASDLDKVTRVSCLLGATQFVGELIVMSAEVLQGGYGMEKS